MRSVIVGCPVYERGWILDRWFEGIRSLGPQLAKVVVVYTPSTDNTYEILVRNGAEIIVYDEGVHGTDRDWTNMDRIQTLATMRNILLDRVTEIGADYYLSVDSDIVMDTPFHLIDELETYDLDAISPTVRLAADRTIINAFIRRPDGWYTRARPAGFPITGQINTQPQLNIDVLCAAKLMTTDLAADKDVRYAEHPRGEDFAWSLAARAKSYRFGLCTTPWEHVMNHE